MNMGESIKVPKTTTAIKVELCEAECRGMGLTPENCADNRYVCCYTEKKPEKK